jgi:hypothetical protein
MDPAFNPYRAYRRLERLLMGARVDSQGQPLGADRTVLVGTMVVNPDTHETTYTYPGAEERATE